MSLLCNTSQGHFDFEHGLCILPHNSGLMVYGSMSEFYKNTAFFGAIGSFCISKNSPSISTLAKRITDLLKLPWGDFGPKCLYVIVGGMFHLAVNWKSVTVRGQMSLSSSSLSGLGWKSKAYVGQLAMFPVLVTVAVAWVDPNEWRHCASRSLHDHLPRNHSLLLFSCLLGVKEESACSRRDVAHFIIHYDAIIGIINSSPQWQLAKRQPTWTKRSQGASKWGPERRPCRIEETEWSSITLETTQRPAISNVWFASVTFTAQSSAPSLLVMALLLLQADLLMQIKKERKEEKEHIESNIFLQGLCNFWHFLHIHCSYCFV